VEVRSTVMGQGGRRSFCGFATTGGKNAVSYAPHGISAKIMRIFHNYTL